VLSAIKQNRNVGVCNTSQPAHVDALKGLQQLQPRFLADNAAGRQCLVAAMQLALSSLQYISTAAAVAQLWHSQGGKIGWRSGWIWLGLQEPLRLPLLRFC
jgi:hypothetical protein